MSENEAMVLAVPSYCVNCVCPFLFRLHVLYEGQTGELLPQLVMVQSLVLFARLPEMHTGCSKRVNYYYCQ